MADLLALAERVRRTVQGPPLRWLDRADRRALRDIVISVDPLAHLRDMTDDELVERLRRHGIHYDPSARHVRVRRGD